jgi:prepilin-type processing-associated H-X9-DG protein
MLLPALNNARERAKTIKCASNLKQVGIGVLGYVDSNNGYFPPDGIKNKFGGDRKYWARLIYEYINGTKEPDSGAYDERYWYLPGGKFSSNVYCCPSSTYASSGSAYVYIASKVCYGVNFETFNYTYSPSKQFLVKITSIPKASSTIWAVESTNNPDTSLIVEPKWTLGSWYDPRLRHGSQFTDRDASSGDTFIAANKGRGNSLFVDGHVSALTFQDMYGDSQNLFRIKKRP